MNASVHLEILLDVLTIHDEVISMYLLFVLQQGLHEHDRKEIISCKQHFYLQPLFLFNSLIQYIIC
jgi:hypothetical protein